jgi:hypothetical protein
MNQEFLNQSSLLPIESQLDLLLAGDTFTAIPTAAFFRRSLTKGIS